MPIPNPVPPLRRLFEELRRRGVVRAAFLYLVGAWVAVQVANIVIPALYLPKTALTVVVLVAALGLPVTVALSWAFEFTAEGIRRTPEEEEGRPLSFRLRALLVVLVIVGTAATGWVGWRTWLGPRAEGDAGGETDPARAGVEELDPRRVAVLYFDDHSQGDSLAYFAEGLTEHLIHRLTQVDGLEVVSRHGVKPYRGGAVPVDSIARNLGAGSLVEGSVQRSGEQVQVTAQLIDGETQAHLMSVALSRPETEPFALQDTLAVEVSRLLRRRLGREIQLEGWKRETGSAEAWKLVQRVDRLREDADSLAVRGEERTARALVARGDSLLARARELAPDWSEPAVLRARLAVVTVDPYSVHWSDAERASVRTGLEHAEEAVLLAPEDPEARIVRGRLRFWLSRHADDRRRAEELLDAAEEDLRTAVRLDEESARGWFVLSQLLHEGRGDLEDARYAVGRAREADAFLTIPADIQYQFFYTSLNRSDFEDAAYWCRAGRARFPDRVDFRACELGLLASLGGPTPDPERARELVEEIRDRSRPQEAAYHVGIARRRVAAVLARAGRADSARALLERLDAGGRSPPPFAYEEAHAYLLLGDEERALDRLEAFLRAAPAYADDVARDPWFERLRDDPRFEELVGG